MKSVITSIKAIVWSRPRSYRQWGQTLPLLVISLPAFIGALGLAMDVGSIYWNQYRLQTADDAAVLAGAFCLPDPLTICNPESTAKDYATKNNISVPSEIDSGPTVGVWSDGLPDITMTLKRQVNLTFTRLVGVPTSLVKVKATAEVGVPNKVYDALPVGLQTCLPGMPAPCPYTPSATIVTFAAQPNPGTSGSPWGPGNWSAVCLPNAGADNTVSICPTTTCIYSSPGFGVSGGTGSTTSGTCGPSSGPKIRNIMDTAQTLISNNTPYVVVPVVDWTGCTGACPLTIYQFAEIKLISVVNGGPMGSYITGQFVNYVNPGVLGPPGTTSIGAKVERLVE